MDFINWPSSKGKRVCYIHFQQFSSTLFLPLFYIIRPTWTMNIWPEQKEKLMMFQICSRLSSRVIYPFIQQMFTEHWLCTGHCVQCWEYSKEQVLKGLIRNTFPQRPILSCFPQPLTILSLSLRSLFVLFISSFSNLSFYFSLLWTLSPMKAGRFYLLLSPPQLMSSKIWHLNT